MDCLLDAWCKGTFISSCRDFPLHPWKFSSQGSHKCSSLCYLQNRELLFMTHKSLKNLSSIILLRAGLWMDWNDLHTAPHFWVFTSSVGSGSLSVLAGAWSYLLVFVCEMEFQTSKLVLQYWGKPDPHFLINIIPRLQVTFWAWRSLLPPNSSFHPWDFQKPDSAEDVYIYIRTYTKDDSEGWRYCCAASWCLPLGLRSFVSS